MEDLKEIVDNVKQETESIKNKVENFVEQEVEKAEEFVEQGLHIRDFLHLTKAMRTEFTIFEDRFRTAGLKTIAEWEKLTELVAKK